MARVAGTPPPAAAHPGRLAYSAAQGRAPSRAPPGAVAGRTATTPRWRVGREDAWAVGGGTPAPQLRAPPRRALHPAHPLPGVEHLLGRDLGIVLRQAQDDAPVVDLAQRPLDPRLGAQRRQHRRAIHASGTAPPCSSSCSAMLRIVHEKANARVQSAQARSYQKRLFRRPSVAETIPTSVHAGAVRALPRSPCARRPGGAGVGPVTGLCRKAGGTEGPVRAQQLPLDDDRHRGGLLRPLRELLDCGTGVRQLGGRAESALGIGGYFSQDHQS